MTRHDETLVETVLGQVGDLPLRQAVLRLFDTGLIDRRNCERRAIRDLAERLGREGMPRCEALLVAAEKFCCSYEKARSAFYDKSNK